MIEKQITIINKLGLHARAAAKLVATASGYQSDIHIEKEGQRVNGKSIMGVMMLAAGKESVITLQAQGADARPALNALEKLINDRFFEAE
ncbi:MAG TPA: HPr family phosphocarrier protein [Gammaproteobacteria bacterium]|nr:HPr family phosphocarrier protein [Gammaproteobacteria bacterium]